MTASIAFVGAGPTTLYTLNALLAHGGGDFAVTVFEAQETAGLGAPYRPGWNDPAMLSNIASVEIPPVGETLLDWLRGRTASEMQALGLNADDVHERTFVPRVVLGAYFQARFEALIRDARDRGVRIDVRTRTRVVDAENLADGLRLTFAAPDGTVRSEVYDHVVLATGHQWPSQQEVRPGYFMSPWPAATLAAVPAVEVGIRGSSLTAIDAAVALAGNHGTFVRQGETLTYEPGPDADGFHMTMMSRKGLLPEADFFFPLPHAPLSVCTPEAIAALIAEGRADLLDAVFDLFRRELIAIDPAYVRATGLAEATIESFSEAYYADRAAADPFDWAQANLDEARANHAARITVPWRDAILRLHEVVAVIVPHLSGAEFQRFNRFFKPVFVDCYGAVPHESIERMLALHRAGKLGVLAVGDHYRLDTHRPEGGVLLIRGTEERHFPVFIEATGQRPLSAIQFPFLSLLEQGIVRDETSPGASDVSRGIVIDDVFHPIADGVPDDRLFCLSLPFIMGRHPFVQGIVSSWEMGEIVGEQLALAVRTGRPVSDAFSEAA